MAFSANGPNLDDALDNGNLIVAGAYKRKPFELPENDNLRHKVLWMQHGNVIKELISFENQRLIVRHANPHGATEGRTYTRYYGLTTTNNEGLPPLVMGITNQFQLPDNIAAGQKVRITVHAVVEGSELPPATKEFTIANPAAFQDFGNQIFVIDGIANPTVNISYGETDKRIGIQVIANAPANANEHFTVEVEREEIVNYQQPTTFSEYQLLGGGAHDRNGVFVEGMDSTVRPGGENHIMAMFKPKFDDQPFDRNDMPFTMVVAINGILQNNGHAFDLGMTLNDLFPNGFRPHFGQGLTNNVQDDFIYFNNLGGARYKRGAAPTNAQLMAMHNAQRHGDPGWGVYANRGGVGVLKFADVIRGQDAQGNETSMVHFSENLLSSDISVNAGVEAERTIDLTGAKKVIVGFQNILG